MIRGASRGFFFVLAPIHFFILLILVHHGSADKRWGSVVEDYSKAAGLGEVFRPHARPRLLSAEPALPFIPLLYWPAF
jgi:hypothetical protein